MLKALGVISIELYTNNPRKIEGLRENGIIVSRRDPIIIEPNDYKETYLKTKQIKSGHLLNFKDEK